MESAVRGDERSDAETRADIRAASERFAVDGLAMLRRVTPEEVMEELRSRCRQRGAAIQIAERAGVSPAFVSQVLASHKPVSERLMGALGFERVIVRKEAR
jgi:hypothetical protein